VLIIPLIFVVLGVIGILIFTGGEVLAGLLDGLDWVPSGVERRSRRKKTN
jgi:hypothetical protein